MISDRMGISTHVNYSVLRYCRSLDLVQWRVILWAKVSPASFLYDSNMLGIDAHHCHYLAECLPCCLH